MPDDAEEAPPARGELVATTESVLRAFGYRFTTNRSGTSTLFEAITEGGVSWRSRFASFEASRVLEVSSFVTDDLYHPSRTQWVHELACRASEAIPLGSFLFRWGEGSVRYRTHVAFNDGAITTDAVARLLNSLAFPLQVWQAAFRLRHSKATPEAALNAALIRLEAFEGEDVSNATRRALLTIVHSRKSPDGYQQVTGTPRALTLL